MKQLFWPDFNLPPINLYSAPFVFVVYKDTFVKDEDWRERRLRNKKKPVYASHLKQLYDVRANNGATRNLP